MTTNYLRGAYTGLRGLRFGPAFATVLLIGTNLAPAQDAAAAVTNAPPPKDPWETTAAAGLTLTRGNSKTLLGTLSLDTKRKWQRNEAGFGIAGGYGEDDDERNTEFVNAVSQYNRLFTDRFYAGVRTDFSYDGIARLSYRVSVGPLAGYYLIKATNTTLAVEAGPSAVFEKHQHEPPNNYFGLRLADRFEQRLSATAKFWQTTSYVPDVEQWSDKYIITTEAGIDAAITKKWSLRVVFQHIYDSQPAPDRQHSDIRLIAGTAYKF